MKVIDKEEFQLQWLAALLSGEYKQTKSYLRVTPQVAKQTNRKAGFCCLGVACDVYKQLTGEGEWTESGAFKLDGYALESFPHSRVQDAFGLKHDPMCDLATMNDDGKKFPVIAMKIDKVVK